MASLKGGSFVERDGSRLNRRDGGECRAIDMSASAETHAWPDLIDKYPFRTFIDGYKEEERSEPCLQMNESLLGRGLGTGPAAK